MYGILEGKKNGISVWSELPYQLPMGKVNFFYLVEKSYNYNNYFLVDLFIEKFIKECPKNVT